MKKLGIVNTERMVLKKLIHNISFFRIFFFKEKNLMTFTSGE